MFSVVIPLYNKAHTITRTLNTVLMQTGVALEVIIVDDGSTDNGVEVVKKFTNDSRIRIIEQKNQGVSAARNMGVACAQCDYIAFLDGDDEWLPGYLSKMKEAIEKYPEAGMYCCAGMIRDENGIYPRIASKYRGQIVKVNYFENPHVFSHTSAIVVAKAIFLRTQGFPLRMRRNEDFALTYSIAFIAPVVYCGFQLSVYVGGVPGQSTRATKEERFASLKDVTDRINLCYENWEQSSPRNPLYLIFDKYDTRAFVIYFLRRKDYKSLEFFIASLSERVKKSYPRLELWLYRQSEFRLFAMIYIYFTKLIWRSHGFPVVGQGGEG